jgi:hypothetical protein
VVLNKIILTLHLFGILELSAIVFLEQNQTLPTS